MPPPHLGRAYCNVFVETASLEVVPAAGAAREAQPVRAVTPVPVAVAVPVPRGGPPPVVVDEPTGGGTAPVSGGALGQPGVHLSRGALVALLVLAGCGVLAFVLLWAAVVVGAVLLARTAGA